MKSVGEWPAASVEIRAIGSLIPDAQNTRTHSEAQVEQLAASMREWGWTIPILVDEEGKILAGHGRVLAAQKLGLADAPVMTARGWTAAQKQAYAIADNKLALNAGWDMEKLSVGLGDLQGAGFDVGLLGFSADELVEMAGGGSAAPIASLAERFGVVPFSVLNAREGWWQDRKAAWLAMGIESEIGRGENLLKFSDTINEPDPKKRAARFNAEPGRHGRSPETENPARFAQRISAEKKAKRAEKTKAVSGNGWANGGPARRDAAFYAKKRAWEKANGRSISTTEFREKHWDGYANA